MNSLGHCTRIIWQHDISRLALHQTVVELFLRILDPRWFEPQSLDCYNPQSLLGLAG